MKVFWADSGPKVDPAQPTDPRQLPRADREPWRPTGGTPLSGTPPDCRWPVNPRG
jgi:hypothetical protein